MGWNPKRFRDSIAHDIDSEVRTRGMDDMAINFEDAAGRKIKISPDYGLQVEDSSGTIIHDTPDCLISTGMAYGGHMYFNEHSTEIDSLLQQYTDDAGGVTTWGAVRNVDLTTYLPSDLTNINAVVLGCRLGIKLEINKLAYQAAGNIHAMYSLEYNTTNTNFYNQIGGFVLQYDGTSASTGEAFGEVIGQSFAPVVWNGTTPYLTWQQRAVWSNLATAADLYRAYSHLYLLGFLV